MRGEERRGEERRERRGEERRERRERERYIYIKAETKIELLQVGGKKIVFHSIINII